jgi:hypothetical protein
MKISNWMKMGAALFVGGGLTLAMPVMNAVGQGSPPTSSVSINPNATLLARGVAVEVVLRVVCPASSSTAQIGTTLSEAIGGRTVTSSSNFQSITCTGTTQRVVALITAPGIPWKTGPALAQATISQCTPFTGCTSASAFKVVKITT